MRLVRYRRERGQGNTYRQSEQHALIVGEDKKRLKIIVQDAPMVLMWVPKKEERFMEDVMVGQHLVFDYDDDGKETGRHRAGGRPYNTEKARIAFRKQWLQFNEGKVPAELLPSHVVEPGGVDAATYGR